MMNYDSIINCMMVYYDFSRTEADSVYTAFIDTFARVASSGETVDVPGLGQFKITNNWFTRLLNWRHGTIKFIPSESLVRKIRTGIALSDILSEDELN